MDLSFNLNVRSGLYSYISPQALTIRSNRTKLVIFITGTLSVNLQLNKILAQLKEKIQVFKVCQYFNANNRSKSVRQLDYQLRHFVV